MPIWPNAVWQIAVLGQYVCCLWALRFCGTWWLIGRFEAFFRSKSRRFECRSSCHIGTCGAWAWNSNTVFVLCQSASTGLEEALFYLLSFNPCPMPFRLPFIISHVLAFSSLLFCSCVLDKTLCFEKCLPRRLICWLLSFSQSLSGIKCSLFFVSTTV